MARILIVDDSKTSRKILRKTLEDGGHEVIGEGTNGEEGFLKYKELQPDIVTLDITMPKMDGIEALKVIRHFDENAIVIMVTAAGQKEKMVDAVKNGAADFITKPFVQDDIIKAINTVYEEK